MYNRNIKKLLIFIITSLVLSGCELFDEMFKFDSQNSRQSSLDNVKFETTESKKRVIISSKCSLNHLNYIYYQTPQDANKNIYNDTKDLISKPPKSLKPYWDIRYVNRVTEYKNKSVRFEKLTGLDFKNSLLFVGTDASKEQYSASIAGAKCVNNKLAAGTTINLGDSPEEHIEYGGSHSTFIYKLDKNLKITKPWSSKKSGNLLIQANFTKPIYKDFENNIGGGVNFGLILRNVKNNRYINYIIGVYAIGNSYVREKDSLLYDHTTKMVHISTAIDKNSKWSTMSPKSQETIRILSNVNELKQEYDIWNSFYRVNITYSNLLAVLKELRDNPPAEVADIDFGVNPEDWEVHSVYIQYELEEEGENALLSGSFRGFEVYTSKLPL